MSWEYTREVFDWRDYWWRSSENIGRWTNTSRRRNLPHRIHAEICERIRTLNSVYRHNTNPGSLGLPGFCIGILKEIGFSRKSKSLKINWLSSLVHDCGQLSKVLLHFRCRFWGITVIHRQHSEYEIHSNPKFAQCHTIHSTHFCDTLYRYARRFWLA